MRFIFLIIFYSKLLLYNDLDCYNAESLCVQGNPLAFFFQIYYDNLMGCLNDTEPIRFDAEAAVCYSVLRVYP